MNEQLDAAAMAASFDFVVVGGGSAGAVIAAASLRGPGAAGWRCSRPVARPRRGADARGVPGAAAEPGDGLDVHRRRGQLRARAGRRPDDGAARQDARRLVGHQLHGLRPRSSGRLRRLGRGRRRPGGATTRSCRTSRRARAWRRAATSSSTPTRTTRRVRSASRCGRRCCPARRSSSTPRWRPGSRAATTTAATGAAREGVVSLLQTTTRDGKRSSTYHAFLEGEVEQRPNLDGDLRRARDPGDPGGTAPAGCGRRESSTGPPTARPSSPEPPRRSSSAPARSVRRRS